MGIAVLISRNRRKKNIKKDSEEHFIMIKGIMHQEDITLINTYAPNQGVLKLLIEVKGETDQKAIVVGDLNTPLSDMDRPSNQKINTAITPLNDTLDK